MTGFFTKFARIAAAGTIGLAALAATTAAEARPYHGGRTAVVCDRWGHHCHRVVVGHRYGGGYEHRGYYARHHDRHDGWGRGHHRRW